MEARKTPWAGLILAGLMLVIAAALVGAFGGSQFAGSFLLNQSLDKNARDIVRQINVLQALRDGETQGAIELLESKLDDDLILLDPQTPYEGLTSITQSRIEAARLAARDYRENNPRQSDRPHVDASVSNFLNK